jgi:predicted ArsR family transcriptional regulator
MVFMADGSAESRTRDRVRRAVGERGPLTARDLATELGLTAAAVRRHLDALAQDGLITERELTPGPAGRGRGRPARRYVLTDLGQEQLATTYDGVATAALHFLSDRAGPGAVEDFAGRQIKALETRMQATVDEAGADLAARTDALARALSDEGFAASARPVGQGTGLAGIQLCQGHCPVRTVATEFRAFCDAETEAISRLLGVHVQRLATLAGGEHVCTTFVPTAAPAGAAGTEHSSATDPTTERRASR